MTLFEILLKCTGIAAFLLSAGFFIAYPARWFNRSMVEDETLIRMGITFIGMAMGIFLCIAVICYSCGGAIY